MTSWRRQVNVSVTPDLGYVWEDAIAAGDSYLRVHITWGFHADTPITTGIDEVSQNLVTFGLVTTVGNGSETPPNPQTQGGNADPPTKRWIYWETRAPVVSAINEGAGVITWRDSGATEPTQTKGQVLAQDIPAGDSLNLFSSWASAFDWGSIPANVQLWHSISILRKV
jgi:hypothetical protein